MQERANNAVMIVELLTSYIVQESKKGVLLTDIRALGMLPAFMNTAQRSLKDLLSVTPEDEGLFDSVKVLAD